MSQSLWNRAMSYDEKGIITFYDNSSQSLWNRAMSYDHHCFTNQAICASQSLWNRAMSYDHFFNMDFKEFLKSQSLWNRAMSYDELNEKQRRNQFPVSIPLEQGNVLRLIDWHQLQASWVSIPLEQGNVLRRIRINLCLIEKSLNPFGTGQCLTTEDFTICEVIDKSQSLWNRAMSYDITGYVLLAKKKPSLNPFGTGQCLTTLDSLPSKGNKCVSIPLEQGNVLRLQWGHQALCDKACRSHFPTFSETQRVGSWFG